MTVRSGLESLLDDPAAWIAPSERVGLLSNPTGVDRRLRSSVDRLHAHPAIALVHLYGPEHGIRGDAQAGEAVPDAVDPRTGLPVTSLYGDAVDAASAFAGIDVLAIDLQDIGTRYYTYLATADRAAREAIAAGARVLVLDRPNPIAWMGVFGNRVAPAHASLVGLPGLPITHGATIGEILRHLARREGRPAPGIVPVDGWRRAMRWEETGLPWVMPSPNLPTLDTAHLYPATCLVEGTSASEGRGTTRPFELIGDPALDEVALASSFADIAGDRYLFRPTTFVPTFSKHAGTRCRGVQVHPAGSHHPVALRLGPHLLAALRRHLGDRFAWTDGGETPFIDRLAGGPELREAIDSGGEVDALMARWHRDAAAYIAEIDPDLVYGPLWLADTGVAA